jgi:enoyl-CoA hydratase/carnithine racemase
VAYSEILYDVADRIATVTLNRPDKLNAWTRVIEGEVDQAMRAAAADDGVRVIVLTGAGRGFCAGADMSLLSAATDRAADGGGDAADGTGRSKLLKEPLPGQLDHGPGFAMRYTYFTAIPKPVIAAVNGPTAGLGLVVALFADMRFASEDAMFTTAFARRGLIAEHGIDWILPRLVGLPNALDMLLSARKVSAQEALAMGLVNKLFSAENFQDNVRAYARELADLVSARSMRVMKEQLYRALSLSLADAVARGHDEMVASFDSPDFKEGVAHFIEKRAPAFTDR